MKKWTHTALIMKKIVEAMDGIEKVAKLLKVNRTFIDSILRGKRPLPPKHAYTLSKRGLVNIIEMRNAHIEDIRDNY